MLKLFFVFLFFSKPVNNRLEEMDNFQTTGKFRDRAETDSCLSDCVWVLITFLTWYDLRWLLAQTHICKSPDLVSKV